MSLESKTHRETQQPETPPVAIEVCPECEHLTEQEILNIVKETGRQVKIVYCPAHRSLEEYFN